MSERSSTDHTRGGLRTRAEEPVWKDSSTIWLVTLRLATSHTHTTPPAVPHARCEPCGLKATASTRSLSEGSRATSASESVVSMSEMPPSSQPTASRPEAWCIAMLHAAPP
jgi:hypothetical protein